MTAKYDIPEQLRMTVPTDSTPWGRYALAHYLIAPYEHIVFRDTAAEVAQAFRETLRSKGWDIARLACESHTDDATVRRMLDDGHVPLKDMLRMAQSLELSIRKYPADYFTRG
ncbi:hypothetical protein [Bifidobacterium subtile]|jgi:hypothetical protein|uniref:hypothetical protein n=1 Tax=Bifidobacterium subtile TaxID=77635 RepID=UPI002F3522AF